ncbi:hypothetical protein MBLNU230_g7151t1 [Neophaeotheca triangularis]
MLQAAIVFTIACVVLTGNAVLSFWPNISPGFTPPPLVLYIEGVLSLMSSALFLIGGAISFTHVVKSKRGESLKFRSQPNYGTVVYQDEGVEGGQEEKEAKIRRGSCMIAVTEVLEKTTSRIRAFSLNSVDGNEPTAAAQADTLTWRTFPTLYELRTYYFTEAQCIAGLISVASSTIYTLTGVLALISIHRYGVIATWIRFPQLVAAVGFATSSTLLMLQSQTAWYRPAFWNMVWHANMLNLIGSLGFIFCSILGLLSRSWTEYHFGSTFLWASWAFLMASALSSYAALRGRRGRVQGSEMSKV